MDKLAAKAAPTVNSKIPGAALAATVNLEIKDARIYFSFIEPNMPV